MQRLSALSTLDLQVLVGRADRFQTLIEHGPNMMEFRLIELPAVSGETFDPVAL